MMMVPIGVSAWTSINLRGGSYDWDKNSSGSEFKKWDDNNFVKAVTPSTTGDYYFRYYVSDDSKQYGPDDTTNDWLLTVNGTDLTATKEKTTKAFYFAATGGVTYYISVRYVSSTWKVSVSDKPIVRIGGCIGGQNNSWDNDKAAYMAYDSTEDAWYYDVSASDFSSWKRSGEGIIGLDFRFREFNGELNYVFSTGSGNNAHTTLTSTYQELASNTSGAGDRFVGVEEVTNATNYRVWYKNDNGTRKAKVEVTTSDPVTPTTGGNNFYLVGNFMSTDGNNASDINYNNKIFRMKYIGNNQYSFDVPATLTVYSQILSVNGSTTQAYGPSNNQTTDPANDGTISGTLTSASAKTNNYWLMSARALSSDGMYTYTITVDANGVPTNWSIKHTQLTRVVYYLPKDGLAQPAYMTRNNSSSAGDNKFFGNVYLNEGQECFVLGNIKGKSAWTDSGNPMPTVTKLYKQGNGGGYVVGNGTNPTHPSGYDDWHKVYPALSSGFKVTPAGALTLEYNPSAGQDEKEKYYANNNIGGEVKRAGGDPMDMIESMKVIGPGVGTDWTLSNAREMTYNETLKCWEIKITTTNAASTANLFRFVANDSWATNWYEDGTSDAVKAKIPYTGSGDGHAATEEDPNVVERTSDAHATPARDIIFNRPAGEWTIRFYTETISSSGGNFFTYNYYYTITGTENPDPSVVTTTINTTGGLYINKVLVEVAYTGDSNKPLYWKVGGAPTTSDNLVSYTDSENNTDNRKFLLSTPGQLYVGDGTNTSDPVTFDFTYSTSENYAGVENNGTVSQIVTSKGGKDCVNVFFKKSENNMSIYVWDAYNDNESTKNLTKVWPGQWMSDDRTLTLNGETFYYVSFPTSDLVQKDGKYKIGFILSNAARGSSDTDADKTKTRDYFLEFNATATAVQGVQETMFYALEANVTANKVVPAGSSYEDQEASTYKGSAAQLFSNNTVYFKNDANWTSPIYCHVCKEDGTKLHELKSNGEMMTLVDATNKIYAYTIPTDYQANLKFANSTSATTDLTFSGNGGKMFTSSTSSWGDAPSSFTTLDEASQTVMNTFLTTPPVTTVESRVYPNGQDYYRNMPNDYTLMLSPTWQLDGSTETRTATNVRPTWDSDSGNTIYLNGGDKIYQTVTGLAAGTYTVQAIVRGGAVPIHLYLNDTEVGSVTLTGDGAGAVASINPFGRCEHLENMQESTSVRSYHKLEGSATVSAGGSLKISIRAEGGADVADVFLLRNANTDGNYWTTAPTSEDVTEYDMSDRSKYNAFSFFDRGANLNSIIKADQKTVIGMSEDNEPYLTGAEKGARRHPCNVVTSSDGGTTWHTPMLALTDYASVISVKVGSENKYGSDPKVSQHAYGTSFDYTADKFSYDRATSAKMMSTMLPFALTRSQIVSMLGSNVKTYTLEKIDKSNLKVTFKETTDNLEANTPFFFRPLQSETESKMALDERVSVVATSETTSSDSPEEGLLGTYKHISDVGKTYKDKDFIPYFYENNTFVWADNDANAKPFRVIFLLNKGGNNARMLNAIFVDDTTTGIDGITENIQQNAPVYSIDGKLVSSDGDTSRLSKGVYVKAGKKFIIK